MPEQVLALQLGVVDEGDGGLAHLTQVVGGDVGRHADRDAGAAVGQELGGARGQHHRLVSTAVEVGTEVDGALLYLVEQLHGQGRHTRLGVAVGRRGVAVERAEVAVTVDQAVAQREVLRHAHHGLVAGGIAMRMILADDGAHDGRALAKLGIGIEVQIVVHRI